MKIFLAILLVFALACPVEAGRRKRKPKRKRAVATKPANLPLPIERRQLLEKVPLEDLQREITHRWLGMFTLKELMDERARREQKPKP